MKVEPTYDIQTITDIMYTVRADGRKQNNYVNDKRYTVRADGRKQNNYVNDKMYTRYNTCAKH